jgi:hypothetical protein
MIANWAKYIVVWVKHDGCASVQTSPASFPIPRRQEEIGLDLNQQLEELLESCVTNDSDISDVARSYASSASSTKKTREPNHYASVAYLQALDLCNVHSAEFQCPETEAKSIYTTVKLIWMRAVTSLEEYTT